MNTTKGFTFVEVVLVLAIAGMIFAMTFVALPNLWASERDAERREDMTSFISALKNYQMNNSRGALPGTASSLSSSSMADNDRAEKGDTVKVSGAEVVADRERADRDRVFRDMSWAGFYRDYVGIFEDPLGVYYDLSISKCTPEKSVTNKNLCAEGNLENKMFASEKGEANGNDYVVHVVLGSLCDGDTPALSSNSRNVSVVYKLERSGQYCYDTK